MSGTAPTRKRALVAAASVLVVGAALAWGFVVRLGFTGVDAWPLLDQAERALRETLALLRERYLEGMPIGASFWRPLFVAAFSLQWAAFGEAALPYHVVRLAAYLALAMLCGSLARRNGASGALAFLTAGAIVLLHPVQADMIPSLARSADVYGDLLLSATILALSRPGSGTLPLAAGVLLALLAPGVKETGLAAPAIGLLVLEPWSPRAGRPRRLASLVLAIGLGLHLVVRLAVLGSLGSYTPRGELEADPGSNVLLLGRVVTDQDGLGATVLVLSLWAAAVLLVRVGRDPAQQAAGDWCSVRRGCWAWLGCALLGAIASPRLADRHAAVLLAPASVLLAAVVASLAVRSPAQPRTRALRGVARASAIVALALALVPRSPLWRRYPQWEVIGRTAQLLVDAADAAARELSTSGRASAVEFGAFRVIAHGAAGGVSVAIDPFPYDAAPPRGARAARLRQPVILMPYSVRAALSLRGHGPHARIQAGRGVSVQPEELGPPSAPRAAARAR